MMLSRYDASGELFAGQYFDNETKLHYNFNRYYDFTLGRYITRDPIGIAGGLNTFSYVGGNPIKYIDPEGEIAIILLIPAIEYGLLAGAGAATGVMLWLGYEELSKEETRTKPDAVPITRTWRDKKATWKVYVRCNVQTFPGANCENCPPTIGGWGYGGNFTEANANAQHDANENLSILRPTGCYKRHCDPVACHVRGQPVRCPKSGRMPRK